MNSKKITLMAEGGHKLAEIKEKLASAVKPGVTPLEIEALAVELINKSGGEASFKMVPKYHYATCINVNDSLVHGIPASTPFNDGDLVSIDLGLYYKGYHTDTSTTVVAGKSNPKLDQFISVGHKALKEGIKQARVGNRISDISRAIETTIEKSGFAVVRDLTGHGVGKLLHEDPYVPNFTNPRHHDPVLYDGQTLAIEPMLTMGDWKIKLGADNWTIYTADGSLSCLIEDTIAITKAGPLVLTK